MPINTKHILIVEDELIIANNIANILRKAGYLSVAMANTVPKAISSLEEKRPLVVITDIMLGQPQSGLDLGEVLSKKYHIPFIYITSFANAEIVEQAKQTRPNAYIVKPFKAEDLLIAIELALFNAQINEPETPKEEGELLIKDGRVFINLLFSSILWLEADDNYTLIHVHNNKTRVIRTPLRELQEQLPPQQFMRIHKSYIVNRLHIKEIATDHVRITDQKLPISRSYSKEVKEIISSH